MTQAPKLAALILGATGYGGGELLRLLLHHPDVGAVQALSRSRGGKPIASAHPSLAGYYAQPFQEAAEWPALAEAERVVVFSALPHGALLGQLPALEAELDAAGLSQRSLLIDLSGDFRLDDAAAFERAYGMVHPLPGRLDDFVYGLPELGAERLRGATRIANPGCFATALALALLPLGGLTDLGPVAAAAMTGSSGSGAQAKAGTHHPSRANDLRAYKVLEHQHQAEIEMALRLAGSPDLDLSFVPHSAPLVRGIFATLQFRRPASLDAAALAARYAAFAAAQPFVRLVAGSPRVVAVAGSNVCELALQQVGDKVAVMSAIDNLVKGMAGQAIQNMNLALGLDPRRGLWFPGAQPA